MKQEIKAEHLLSCTDGVAPNTSWHYNKARKQSDKNRADDNLGWAAGGLQHTKLGTNRHTRSTQRSTINVRDRSDKGASQALWLVRGRIIRTYSRHKARPRTESSIALNTSKLPSTYVSLFKCIIKIKTRYTTHLLDITSFKPS